MIHTQAVNNRAAIDDIKRRLRTGELSYDKAKEEAQPIIERINANLEKLAKKYGQKPHKVNFTGLMR